MRPKKFTLLVLLILTLSLVVLGGCSKESTPANTTITVGIHSWPGNGPVYVGAEKGFFKKEGIDLKLQRIESFDSRRAALIGGQIDVDCTTLDQLLIVWETGNEAQVFGISDVSTGGDGVVAKKEITSLEGLKGKRVAYAEASPSDFFLRYVLKQNGISFSDIEPNPVADAQAAGTAIIAEQVDAAVTFEPWLSASTQNPNIHIIATTKEYPKLIPGIYVARASDLAKREELFRGFMRAWFESVQYFIDHPDESKEIMTSRMDLTLEDLDAILGSITIVGKEGNLEAFDKNAPDNMYELVGAISEFWKTSGFITEEFTSQSLVRPLVDQTSQVMQ